MGTRHSIMIFHDGKYKMGQYGQWDGYPKGAGTGVLEFLREMDKDKFLKNLSKTKKLSKAKAKEINVKLESGKADLKKDYPSLSRDTSSKILGMIQDMPDDLKEPMYLNIDETFPYDSLFCEWTYVIDFDKNAFEVYQGFNKVPTPDDSRFPSSKKEKTNDSGADYEPSVMVCAWALNNLPSNEDFLSQIEACLNENEEESKVDVFK